VKALEDSLEHREMPGTQTLETAVIKGCARDDRDIDRPKFKQQENHRSIRFQEIHEIRRSIERGISDKH